MMSGEGIALVRPPSVYFAGRLALGTLTARSATIAAGAIHQTGVSFG